MEQLLPARKREHSCTHRTSGAHSLIDRSVDRWIVHGEQYLPAHAIRHYTDDSGSPVINYIVPKENELPLAAITAFNAATIIDDAAINAACRNAHLSRINN